MREPAVTGLLARAFAHAPSREATARIAHVREEVTADAGGAFSYEVVLTPERGWRYLRDDVAPLLAYHLYSMKRTPDAPGGLFLALFDGDDLYFLRATDFFAHYREIEGLSREAFAARARSWRPA